MSRAGRRFRRTFKSAGTGRPREGLRDELRSRSRRPVDERVGARGHRNVGGGHGPHPPGVGSPRELVGAEERSRPEAAKFVTHDGVGAPVVTDGPFPESKEFLAGTGSSTSSRRSGRSRLRRERPWHRVQAAGRWRGRSRCGRWPACSSCRRRRWRSRSTAPGRVISGREIPYPQRVVDTSVSDTGVPMIAAAEAPRSNRVR